MPHSINRVAVIGTGTMGAAIAAHVANAGLPVLLLDIAPDKLTPQEEAQGLTLASPAVRNRIVRAGFERARKARPAAFMSQAAEGLVTLGNTVDDFEKLAEVDWIVEAIIEKLAPKQALLARIETVRQPGSIVTSNTSGLPIASLAEGGSDEFKRHFFGAHFFNPPRYLKLLEIIPTAETDPALVQAMATFAENGLGKGPVFCNDTPNFIGNRLFSLGNTFAIDYALENGYTVEEVDALTGPLLGRPKTATFRLLDLVGIDVAAFVAQNLHELIPHDSYRDVLRAPGVETVLGELLKRGWLGNKSGQGFYKQGRDAEGKRVFTILNPNTFEYDLPQKPRFEAVGAVRKIDDLGERLRALLDERWRDDRAAQYVWAVLSFELAYAAACAQEIAHDLKSIDEAVRWGFAFEAGPFQLWDKLDVAATAARMEALGREIAPWVKEMLAAGGDSFYRVENGRVTGYYDWHSQQYKDMPANPRHIKIDNLRSAGRERHQNDSASIHDLGEGVLLLEFHAKMNAIDDEMVKMMAQAQAMLADDDYVGLVIGNEGENFCVGANLFVVAVAAQQSMFDQIERTGRAFQEVLHSFRYSPKPVVVAVHNRALGGGAEIVLGASRVVAHAESTIGLVEPGVGLVPAGGGAAALVRRIISGGMRVQHADPLPLAQQVFETIGLAKVGSSAAENRELGFLGPNDRIVMNRDHLLHEAKQEVLSMVAAGYVPPPPAQLYAGGRDLYAALKMGVWLMQQGGFITEHEALIGDKLAFIIAGGDLSAPQWVDEQYFLDLEGQAFMELVATEKTQARMWHMLQEGKPLRN
ncbi:MAG TPA: 3-hydroxyacyl-CoA dehydrogenase/enoyl-CoA hydratase family protein [Anaerolineae bacterium]